ncbi:MAG: hypothetical protein CL797_00745 [Chromatiales bacterium]|nr:hypothetical protein [Chromatiales bacterium]
MVRMRTRQNRCQTPCTFAGVICALLISFAPLSSAYSKDQPFEIRSAESRLFQSVWFANALIDFRLSDEALAALDSGVVLTIELQIRLDRVRRFWLDKETAMLEQSFELSYQPLSERYVVRNLNSGEQDSFATLFSALNSMGRIVDLPIIDASLLDADEQYEIALRAVLDQNTLPGPLRLLAFWSSGFRLESDWYVWILNA